MCILSSRHKGYSGRWREFRKRSAGYVEVKNDLAIDINATSNDAIGIYISGSEHNGVVPEVHLNNSNIKIKSTSSRANAIRLGKTASIGTGEGRLFQPAIWKSILFKRLMMQLST